MNELTPAQMNTLIKRMVPQAEFTNPSVKMAKADFLIEKKYERIFVKRRKGYD